MADAAQANRKHAAEKRSRTKKPHMHHDRPALQIAVLWGEKNTPDVQ